MEMGEKNEKRGDAVSCPQVPVIRIWYVIHNEMVFPKENLCERAILVNLCPNVSVLPGVEVINLGLFAPATLLDLSYQFVTSGLYMSGLNLISRSFQCEFSWFLNPFTVFDSITFAGKLFHTLF